MTEKKKKHKTDEHAPEETTDEHAPEETGGGETESGGLRLYEVLARMTNPQTTPPQNMEAGSLVYLTDEDAAWGRRIGFLEERSLVFAAKGDLTGTLPTTDMGTSEVV